MEVVINLPERIYAHVSHLAAQTRRRVDEIIVEKIEQEFSFDAESLTAQLEVSTDAEVVKATHISVPPRKDRRLSLLLQKQGAQDLTAKEKQELAELMNLSRLATLKKAFALREAARRGLHVED